MRVPCVLMSTFLIREVGSEEFGTRTETKNLNSFKAIARAIENERESTDRSHRSQVKRLSRRQEDGMILRSIHILCDPRRMHRITDISLILTLYLSTSAMSGSSRVRDAQPEFRDEKKIRYKEEYAIPDYDIDIITDSKKLADLFEDSDCTGSTCKEGFQLDHGRDHATDEGEQC